MYYGANHPMKPQRIAMTHHLILGYDLHREMENYRPRRAGKEELLAFHTEGYLDVLRGTSPDEFKANTEKYLKYGLEGDCPIFEGLWDYCRLYAGATVEAASKLNHGQCDIAINWAGGLHHGKRAEASGFCYINDCVLGILELLKYHARVLYIDIDIHHGDGVEEAFYTNDRVMTVSFHLHRPDYFFPGTGALTEIGEGPGRGYSVNVPLFEGCDDEQYLGLFKPIMAGVLESFRPGAIVLQCGADALVGDRLGALSLTLEGHAEAVAFVKSFGIPMLVLGGGGYTKATVARAWTLDTAVLLGTELEDMLPANVYLEYFSPEYRLRYNRPKRYESFNKKEDLEFIKMTVLENLRHLQHAPGVGIQEWPPEGLLPDMRPEDGGETEEVVFERLKSYAQLHFKHTLSCIENTGNGFLNL